MEHWDNVSNPHRSQEKTSLYSETFLLFKPSFNQITFTILKQKVSFVERYI